METKILLAYASTHGSTQEVAACIAAVLREHGLIVDLQPAHKVRSVEGYHAVVLGAPLYIFRLHRDGTHFISRHRKAFAGGLPLAVFAGGPFSTGDEKEWGEVRRQLDKELGKFSWLKPVAVKVVGGKFDPFKLRFPWNLIPALKQIPANDLRDWDEIRAWASSLAVQFACPIPGSQPAFAD